MATTDRNVRDNEPASTVLSGPAGRAHLIGARGAGMKALGELLLDRGWKLTGSDESASDRLVAFGDVAAAARPYPVYDRHAEANVSEETDVVLFSPAIPEGNPEREAARRLGVPQLSYPQAIGRLMTKSTGICVAGTHGKTTTTAMLATILRAAGRDPSALVGGELIQYGRNGWSGRGPHLIAESCEYRSHFLEMRPELAVILGIEPDHFDCFQNQSSIQDAFHRFANQVPADGLLLVRGDCAESMLASRDTQARVETVSTLTSANWNARNRSTNGLTQRFDILQNDSSFCRISLNVPGEHNVFNAVAATALASAAGLSPKAIADGLAEFRGVRRRFETVGSWKGVTLIDDYAHHPTALAATLKTARACFPDRRLVCVFQPHQILRTEKLLSEFGTAFGDADQVLLVPVFAAREFQSAGERASRAIESLASRIERDGVAVCIKPSLDQLLTTLDDAVRSGDVLLTLGAGDIDQVPHELTRTVRRHYSG